MLKPLDIQNEKFKSTLLGYSKDEVDDFLDNIIKDYESLHIENKEMKSRINLLVEQVGKYKELEENLKDAVVVAQTTGDQVVKNAEQEATNIIDSANLEKIRIINEAEEKIEKLKTEYDVLRKEVYIFKTRFESFLKSQLITIDEFYNEANED